MWNHCAPMRLGWFELFFETSRIAEPVLELVAIKCSIADFCFVVEFLWALLNSFELLYDFSTFRLTSQIRLLNHCCGSRRRYLTAYQKGNSAPPMLSFRFSKSIRAWILSKKTNPINPSALKYSSFPQITKLCCTVFRPNSKITYDLSWFRKIFPDIVSFVLLVMIGKDSSSTKRIWIKESYAALSINQVVMVPFTRKFTRMELLTLKWRTCWLLIPAQFRGFPALKDTPRYCVTLVLRKDNIPVSPCGSYMPGHRAQLANSSCSGRPSWGICR